MIALFLIFGLPGVHAMTRLECTDPNGKVTTLEYVGASPNGAPGADAWNLSHGGLNYPGEHSSHVVAKSSAPGGVDIVITQAETPNGAVGVTLQLRALDTDEPVLTPRIFGGWVGSLRLPAFPCRKVEAPCAERLDRDASS